MTRLYRLLLVVPGLLVISAGLTLAQTNTALPDSSCHQVPDASTDVVICPENALTNGSHHFVEAQIFVRDARYGWLRLTPCDGILTICERIYLEGVINPSESIEVSLDDPGDGPAPK